MRTRDAIICILFLVFLVWLSASFLPDGLPMIGGLSVLGWSSIAATVLLFGLALLMSEGTGLKDLFGRGPRHAQPPPSVRTLTRSELDELGVDRYRGPSYPHPVIFPERCIGCQACVEACPHDVLAIVDGVASAVAPDLCMEDTACQAECPVNPKACIVINTTKEIRSLPMPQRDGATFETNVPGVYLIGDVSGVPLIKNAVREGSEVIRHIAQELAKAEPDAETEHDVAIVGVGPGGASAAATAQEMGLRYIALEQNSILSTIESYPKGKYIFFKPDTKDWEGGVPVAGLGLRKSKYGSNGDEAAEATSSADETELLAARVSNRLLEMLPGQLRMQLSELVVEQVRQRAAKQLQSGQASDEIVDDLVRYFTAKVPGDQRENILDLWLGTLREKNVIVRENEPCRSIERASDGDHFIIHTTTVPSGETNTYAARRVVIAIGLRGAPNKLRLPNEDMRVKLNGVEEAKVLYSLSDPMQFRGRSIVIVGGGNVAVEAAVDLVAIRNGAEISPRNEHDMNKVTLLVRDSLAPTVKFGNKYQLYKCADDGLIDLRFGIGIRELREREVVLEDVGSKEIVETIPNDYVFAMIGGERPNRFLESIGITIK
jgi:thioredoxin reductase